MIKQFNAIIRVSDREEIIQRNFLEALDYVDNLSKFLNRFSKIGISDKDVVYLPSFYGKYVSEELCRASTTYENEMRLFILKSERFLEDIIKTKIIKDLSQFCEISQNENTITFILKEWKYEIKREKQLTNLWWEWP